MARSLIPALMTLPRSWILSIPLLLTLLLAGCGGNNTQTTDAIKKANDLSADKKYGDAITTLGEAITARIKLVSPDATLNQQDIDTKSSLYLKILSDPEILKMEHAELQILLQTNNNTSAASLMLGQILLGNPGDPAMSEALHNPDVQVRLNALSTISLSGDPTLVSAMKVALQDTDSAVRREAASDIGGLGGDGAVDALIPLLKDSDIIVRANAADSLGRLRDLHAVDSLLQSLSDSDESVSLAAETSLLVLIQQPGAKSDDFSQYMDNPNPRVALVAANCTSILGDTRAVPTLIRLSASKDPKIYVNALKVLGDSGDPRAIPTLHQFLASTDENVLGWCIQGLGKLKDKTALPALQALASSDRLSPAVREAAMDAIDKINLQ